MTRARLRPDPRLTFSMPVLRSAAPMIPETLWNHPQPARDGDVDALLRDMESIGRESLRYRHASAWHRDRVRAVWRHIAMAWHLAAVEGRIERARRLLAEDAIDRLREIQKHEARLDVAAQVRTKVAASAAKARRDRSRSLADERQDALNRAGTLRDSEPGISDREIARRLSSELDLSESKLRRWLGGR